MRGTDTFSHILTACDLFIMALRKVLPSIGQNIASVTISLWHICVRIQNCQPFVTSPMLPRQHFAQQMSVFEMRLEIAFVTCPNFVSLNRICKQILTFRASRMFETIARTLQSMKTITTNMSISDKFCCSFSSFSLKQSRVKCLKRGQNGCGQRDQMARFVFKVWLFTSTKICPTA